MSIQEIKSLEVPSFWWKSDGKNRLFQYYKVTLAVYLCSMSYYGWRDQKLNPKNVHGTHCYTDYVSNWSDIICSIWGLVSAYLAVNPNSSDRLYRFSNGLNSIAPTWSIGVAGAFWCLLPADRQTLDLVSLHQHAALAILTFADLLITNSKISLKLIVPAWFFATLYATNTVLVWLIFGKERDEIYPMINYSEKFWDAIIFDVSLIFGVQSAVFFMLLAVSKLKTTLLSVKISKLE